MLALPSAEALPSSSGATAPAGDESGTIEELSLVAAHQHPQVMAVERSKYCFLAATRQRLQVAMAGARSTHCFLVATLQRSQVMMAVGRSKH
jgi:hypothetical protein